MPALIFIVLIMPLFAGAQGGSGQPNPGGSGQPSSSIKIVFANPFKESTVEGLIRVVVNDILIPIGGVIAVLMIMYAGFLFVTARGNTGQIDKARYALLYAVIGAALLLGAWVISEAIQGTIEELQK